MPSFHKRDNAWYARFYTMDAKGVRCRHQRAFPTEALASLCEYKADFEYFIRKHRQDPAAIPDVEVPVWCEAFLRGRRIKPPLDRTKVQIAISAHILQRPAPPAPLPILAALDRHIEGLAARKVSPGTLANYHSYRRRLAIILPQLKVESPADISPQFPQSLHVLLAKDATERGTSISTRTTDLYVGAIQAALHAAGAPQGPWLSLKRLEAARRSRSLMTIGEIEQFLGAATDHEAGRTVNGHPFWFAFFYTLYLSARRVSEITRRTWQDVHFDSNILAIPVQKGNAGPISCPLADPLLRSILAPKGHRQSDLVFPAKSGRVMDNSIVLDAFKRIAAAAGLHPSYSPHHLRHAATTYLIAVNPGIPRKNLMAITGHRTSSAFEGYEHLAAGFASKTILPAPGQVRAAMAANQ